MNTITNTNRKSATTARQPAPEAAAPVEVTPEDIRCRAHEIFCSRNGVNGDQMSDWLQAEQELTGALGRQCATIAD
jgi:hypothetical protein